MSLGFYGDLKVAGLNREQIKVKLVEHLRKFLSDEALGLAGAGEKGKEVRIEPKNSDRVSVDDGPFAETPSDVRIRQLEERIERLTRERHASLPSGGADLPR